MILVNNVNHQDSTREYNNSSNYFKNSINKLLQANSKSKLAGNFDAGIAAAAKNGGITKIGSVDVVYLSTGKFIVKVTGE